MSASVKELLVWATALLQQAEVPSPVVDAKELLCFVAKLSRSELEMGLVTGQIDLTSEAQEHFRELVSQRSQRIPLQHLTGRAPFRYRELRVGPGVFIPRPETELLVQYVVDELGQLPPEQRHVVDLCTGSGAIALAIGTEVPATHVWAVELSDLALEWAHTNLADAAAELAASGSRVELLQADVTDPTLVQRIGQVAAVATNPPYVPTDARVTEPEVRKYDPQMALYGGPDGLDVVRGILANAARLLRPSGLLVLEHANVQGPALMQLLQEQRNAFGEPMWEDIRDCRDLADQPRHALARRTSYPSAHTSE